MRCLEHKMGNAGPVHFESNEEKLAQKQGTLIRTRRGAVDKGIKVPLPFGGVDVNKGPDGKPQVGINQGLNIMGHGFQSGLGIGTGGVKTGLGIGKQ
ncbi:hypothetical protein DdX_06148 [Ditylenchus destructor]|uniref:Uncharacterized protein n=1 Tax=Ditylenchus destructor TaxID=166010 RepID=A0AAD4NBV7_9BILA|nr:hypothetical protein DdX_06148 [Ditylenchus destructor]